jgi:hypothetical protein
MGLAIRSARSWRNISSILAMRGTPSSLNAPDTMGFFDVVRHMYRRHASDTCDSMSLLVENAVAR